MHSEEKNRSSEQPLEGGQTEPQTAPPSLPVPQMCTSKAWLPQGSLNAFSKAVSEEQPALKAKLKKVHLIV